MREPDAQAPFRLPGDARQIVLVRHGAAVLAEAADGERSCMDADPGLAGLGHAQARAVAGRLASTAGLAPSGETMAGSRSSSAPCSVLFSSGLHRADATAEHISRALGLSIRRVPSLREVGLGEYDGPAFERARDGPDSCFARALEEERWDVLPGAEAMDDFAARVRSGLAEIVDGTPVGEQALVVTHGGVIGEICHQVTGSRRFAFIDVENASLTSLVVTGAGKWALRSFNDTAHLVVLTPD